jgi:lysophospholipase L1-like esterase
MILRGVPYNRNIQRFEKKVARTKWQVNYLPKWWPGVKDKPVLISEGDSWFDFPVKSLTDVLGVLLRYTIGLQNFGMDQKTNVIDYVSQDKKLDALTLRIERSGDHAQELAAKEPDRCYGVWEDKFPSQTLYTALQNKYVKKHLDLIMLSAGGNDMVKAVRKGVLQPYQGSFEESYDQDLLTAAATEIVQFYLQAILCRDQFAPKAKILCHSYAYPIHVHSGTTVTIDLKDVAWLVDKLLKYMNLEWIKKHLEAIGIDVEGTGKFKTKGKANLHETFDKLNWPSNPINEEGVGVHPERAKFIRKMLDTLYEEMKSLPELYKAETGKDLSNFEYLDIRNEVQDPKYWADFIHLNPEGYKEVGKIFTTKVKSML